MNPFYNRKQARLRAGWRLLLQFIIFILGSVLIGALDVLLLPSRSRAGLITGDVLNNPAALSALLSDPMAKMPYLSLLGSAVSMLFIVLSYWLAARFFDHRPWRDFGFHFGPAWWRDLGFGLALGAVLMAFIFGVEWAAGWITIAGRLLPPASGVSLAGGLLIGALDFVFVGIYEEMLSRGYQMRNLAEGWRWRFIGPRTALLLAYFGSSLFFGLLHQGNPNAGPLTTPFLALAGLFLGLGFLLTGELAIPIGLHIAWNYFQGYVFGFPVSGTGHAASLITIRQSGPVAWTGGAWGPEGGYIGLLALLLGSALIAAWVWRTRGALRPVDRLAVYERPNFMV